MSCQQRDYPILADPPHPIGAKRELRSHGALFRRRLPEMRVNHYRKTSCRFSGRVCKIGQTERGKPSFPPGQSWEATLEAGLSTGYPQISGQL